MKWLGVGLMVAILTSTVLLVWDEVRERRELAAIAAGSLYEIDDLGNDIFLFPYAGICYRKVRDAFIKSHPDLEPMKEISSSQGGFMVVFRRNELPKK